MFTPSHGMARFPNTKHTIVRPQDETVAELEREKVDHLWSSSVEVVIVLCTRCSWPGYTMDTLW